LQSAVTGQASAPSAAAATAAPTHAPTASVTTGSMTTLDTTPHGFTMPRWCETSGCTPTHAASDAKAPRRTQAMTRSYLFSSIGVIQRSGVPRKAP